MTVSTEGQALVQQKLAAFERLQPAFEESFQFVGNVHGLQRFSSFPIAETVHYMHALWICECKDRLLSVYRNIERYGGFASLELLLRWQEQQDTASVVAFLHRKLDMLPLADITRQVHEARYTHRDDGLAQRLKHGRMVLLNRGMNLMTALDAIFARPEEEVFREVRAACEYYGHRPEQLARQMEEITSPLYAYEPHQALARCNMMVMNRLGIDATSKPADQPGRRSWRVVEPTEPLSPYAEHVVYGYLDMTSLLHNNPAAIRPARGGPTGSV